jgi:thiamine pyrophosphate-dependent acetolactate synthase large subunit-like protein
MSTEQKSGDTLSGVVMGKSAAAAISGAAASGVDGGTVVSRVLQAQGVKYLFTVNGGHIWPILATLREHGVQLIHMRHEQTCAYAADAWARTTGTPGVCSVTAGCGLTNAVTGLCAAGLANSAVVCIAGQHPTTEDALGSFQEAYGSEVCGSFSKFTKRVLDWSTIEVDLRQAFC